MSKTRLGLWIIASGLLIALVIALFFLSKGIGIPTVVLAVPAIILLLGVLVMATDLLKNMDLDDEVQDAGNLLADDIDDLRHGRISLTWATAGMAIICLGTELFLLDYFQKWNAAWGPFNVVFLGILAALIASYKVFRSKWFQYRRQRTPQRVTWLLLAGFILCTGMGVYFSEPIQYGSLQRSQQIALVSSGQYYQASRASQFDIFSGDNFTDIDVDCDDDLCLVILVAAVVIACIVASAFIPHFWVLATILMSTLICLVALRELFYSGYSTSQART